VATQHGSMPRELFSPYVLIFLPIFAYSFHFSIVVCQRIISVAAYFAASLPQICFAFYTVTPYSSLRNIIYLLKRECLSVSARYSRKRVKQLRKT